MIRGMNDEITVILTLYKRPDMLAKQLEAMGQQTIKPTRILLFQDRLPGGYQIVLERDLESRFDEIRRAEENIGVWGRFDYAREVREGYVCIFDDDTIPGRRWLENCIYHAKKRDGIYGTIGIILTERDGYPEHGYYRVGWDAPNERCTEVDFVGHSWFFHRRCLDYMFDGTQKYQDCKTAAEDMCLSAMAKQHGIRTFVPPHPKSDRELYGSDPETARKVGMSRVGISINTENRKLMGKALAELQDEGWMPLYCDSKRAIDKGYRQYQWMLRRRWMKHIVNLLLRKDMYG